MDVITYAGPNFNDGLVQGIVTVAFQAFVSNYIPVFYMHVITYPRLNPDGCSANRC